MTYFALGGSFVTLLSQFELNSLYFRIVFRLTL